MRKFSLLAGVSALALIVAGCDSARDENVAANNVVVVDNNAAANDTVANDQANVNNDETPKNVSEL